MTENEKQDKKRYNALLYLGNKIKSDWSFGKIKIYGDLLQAAQYSPEKLASYFPSELNRKLSFQDVKDFLDDLRISLDVEIYLRDNPPKLDEEVEVIPQEASTSKNVDETVKLPPCAREKAFLFWFQKRAAAALLQGILGKEEYQKLCKKTT